MWQKQFNTAGWTAARDFNRGKYMDEMIKDLKNLMSFKDTVAAGDIVLIVAEKPQMLVYALVGDIVRDETKVQEWWHVSMQMLTLPPQKVVWTLRTPQMTGLETFTMDGEERFMKAVDFGQKLSRPGPEKQQINKKGAALRRVK
jgi:hypothetical protein